MLPDLPHRPALAGAAVVAALLAWTPQTEARVTKIVIDDTQPLAATGQTIAYEQISGRAFGELNPNDPLNRIIQDIELGKGAHVRCNGKGRKERATPLPKETVTVLKSWTKERRGEPDDPLFPTRRGTPLSRRAVEDLVAKHAATATNQCPSLETKHPTPHAIRHGCAMELLRSKVDISVIALWLGHERPETTHRMYIHGDLSIKERALACTTPLNAKPGRYRPTDQLVAFLDSL